jgi:hypothetical protein
VKQEILIPAEARQSAVERLGRVLMALPMARYRVTIEEAKATRSGNQNRFLWGVVYPAILGAGKLEGWDSEDVHEYLLGEWSGWETLEGFDKKRLRPIRRSSKLNKREFVDYIEFIQKRMAEHGIYVPDPNE